MGRTCSRAHLSPLRPLRQSLKNNLLYASFDYNDLNNKAKQAVRDAAGSGVSITF